MTPELVQQLFARRIVRDFLRFAAVGAVATAAHYAVLIVLKEFGGMHPVWATVCGYSVGAVVSYTLNRMFTFEVKPAYGRGLVKFLAVIAVGGVLNAAIMAFFLQFGLHYLIAQLIATGLVLIYNFLAARFLVFR
jgi:putative flippase GtrA